MGRLLRGHGRADPVDLSKLGPVGPDGVSGARITAALHDVRPGGFDDRAAPEQAVLDAGDGATALLLEEYGVSDPCLRKRTRALGYRGYCKYQAVLVVLRMVSGGRGYGPWQSPGARLEIGEVGRHRRSRGLGVTCTQGVQDQAVFGDDLGTIPLGGT